MTRSKSSNSVAIEGSNLDLLVEYKMDLEQMKSASPRRPSMDDEGDGVLGIPILNDSPKHSLKRAAISENLVNRKWRDMKYYSLQVLR